MKKAINEADRILVKFPDRIPVIVSKDPKCSSLSKLDRSKFLVPKDFTCGQFLFVIRKRLTLPAEKAIFIFVGESTLPATSELISTLYENHKSDDGFLYISYSAENTFGH